MLGGMQLAEEPIQDFHLSTEADHCWQVVLREAEL